MTQLLSDRDAARLEVMLRWFDDHVDIQYPRRRHKTRGGGGTAPRRAFVKTTPGATTSVDVYLGEDLAAWSGATTYSKGDWVEDSGTEYRSLQNNNLSHAVGGAAWWASGTKSVTVSCYIYGGGNLEDAFPTLVDGMPLWVQNDAGTWRNVTSIYKIGVDCGA